MEVEYGFVKGDNMLFKMFFFLLFSSMSLHAVELENKKFFYSVPFIDFSSFRNQKSTLSKADDSDEIQIFDNSDFNGVPKIIITSTYTQGLDGKKIMYRSLYNKLCDDWECDNTKNPFSFLKFNTFGVSLTISDYKGGVANLKIGGKYYYFKKLIESKEFSSRTYSSKEDNSREYALQDKVLVQEWEKFKKCVKQKSFECLASIKVGKDEGDKSDDIRNANNYFQKHFLKYLKLRLILDNPVGKPKLLEHLKKINNVDLEKALDLIVRVPPELEIYVGSLDVFWDKLNKISDNDLKETDFWFEISIEGKLTSLYVFTKQKDFVQNLGATHENIDIEIEFKKNSKGHFLFRSISVFKFGYAGRQ